MTNKPYLGISILDILLLIVIGIILIVCNAKTIAQRDEEISLLKEHSDKLGVIAVDVEYIKYLLEDAQIYQE